MPWTLAHAAAVKPLRRYASFLPSAAILGTFAPDYGYYLGPPHEINRFTHTLLGASLLSAPLAWIFWRLLYWPWRRGWHEIFSIDVKENSATPSLSALIWVFVGTWSHVLWDSFTHRWGFVAGAVEFLQESVAGRPVYNWLQHLSTLAGTVVVYLWWRSSARPTAGFWQAPRLWIGLAFLLGLASYPWIPIERADLRLVTAAFWAGRFATLVALIGAWRYASRGGMLGSA